MAQRMTTVLVLLLLGSCTPEADNDTRRTARGTAGGVVGARADSIRRDGSQPDRPPADTAGPGAPMDWTAGVVDVASEGAGVALQQDVRVATHDDYDRIVLDFGDDELPGYRIEYIDRPIRACGSGETVELPGEGWLSIQLTPAAAHDEQGQATVTSRDLPVELPVILRLRSTCDFEGIVAWVAAVRSPNPFRVLALEAPNRLVIDVRR